MKYNDLNELVTNFDSIPFIFAGSGVTRRYYDLPDWEELLKIMIRKFNPSDVAYSHYEDRARRTENEYGKYPKIASLIEHDFNERWFTDEGIRTLNADLYDEVKNNICSPFKAEIASYIMSKTKLKSEYKSEVTQLSRISDRSIAGIITTNYDNFFETYISEYSTYVGQNELLFANLQNIAETYKIHGSIAKPKSIVITDDDYKDFTEKSDYLASKLLTIFMEFPIIFLGYSINDENIRKILESIVKCVTPEKMGQLQEKFIFVNYQQGHEGYSLDTITMTFSSGKMISMVQLTLSDYSILYKALEHKTKSLPVRLLRIYKDELYNYVLTNEPTEKLKVALLDDQRVKSDDLVIALGTKETISIDGLVGIESDEWYKNVVIRHLPYSDDQLLSKAIEIARHQNWKLPVNILLNNAENTYGVEKYLKIHSMDDFFKKSRSLIRHKENIKSRFTDIQSVLDEKLRFDYETYTIACLQEDNLSVEDLEKYLRFLFEDDENILSNLKPNERTNVRRLIRIYDYLKAKSL